MRAALASTDGVWQVGVDWEADSIYVAYDARLGAPAAAAKPLCAVVEAAGYEPCWMRTAGWPDGASATPVRRSQ